MQVFPQNNNLKQESVILYGSEVWTILKEDPVRLESFEMWIWREMQSSARKNTRRTQKY